MFLIKEKLSQTILLFALPLALLAMLILLKPTATQATGEIALWHFDETSGTTAADSAGSNNGILMNGPVWTAGKLGSALQFDGVNDYVNATDYDFTASDSFTLSAWFKLNAYQAGDYETIVGQDNEFALKVRNDRFQWFVRSTSALNTLSYFTTVNLNTWYYLTGTRDASTHGRPILKLYFI